MPLTWGCVVLLGFLFFVLVDGSAVALVGLWWGCLYALMESLILAQDERWRRA